MRAAGYSTAPLDLSDLTSIETFLGKVQDMLFDGLVCFASTYIPDADNADFFKQAQLDVQINALAPIYICRSLRFNPGAKIVLFGDAGLAHPKKGHTGYTVSKTLLFEMVKPFAVEMAPNVSVTMFRLGPTVPPVTTLSMAAFYDRSLLRVEEPIAGLLRYCGFILDCNNMSFTGQVIDYDGGAYIIRGK